MEWQVIVALVVAIPVLLIPVVLIWYLNIGGMVAAVREARRAKATHREQETIAEKIG
jgi:hypothetical protein